MIINFYKINSKILLLVLLFFNITTTAEAKIYALCVGVSQYQNSSMNLNYCHTDATEIYNFLYSSSSSDCMQLLTNSSATHDNIVYYAKKIFLKATADDVVLFYFSGHGSYDLFCTYDNYLYFSTLKNIFQQCKATRKIIFADSCFSGTLRESQNTSSHNSTLGKNVLLFLASRSNQTSIETASLKNGLFTYYLLAGLRGGADLNKDKAITAIELFKFVNPKVKQYSGGSQVPVMWGKFDKNMTIIMLKK